MSLEFYQHRLDGALGYAQLQMWQEAWQELEKLPADYRTTDEVLDLSLGVLVGLNKYDSATVLAESMISNGSQAPSTFLLGAQAIREARSVPEAIEFLKQGEQLLAASPLFHYLMACLVCQAGDIPETKRRLERRFKLDMSYREKALEESDLEPLWTSTK